MSAVPKQPAQANDLTDPQRVDLQAIITFSKAPNKESMGWEKVTALLSALLTSLRDIQVGKKGDGNAWAPATFKEGRRKAEYALETHLLVLDSDAGHPLPVLRSRFEAFGWYAVIIPSPSWGSDVLDVNENAFNRWADEVRQAEGAAAATPERFLIERHNKTPAVAAGAEIINRYAVEDEDKEGRKRLTLKLRIRHQPGERYRIICVLSEPCDLSTKEGRRAWTRYYDAVVDQIGLPLDRSCGSPERLFYLSRLPAKLIEDAKNHIATVEGSPIVVADLPEPKRLDRTRRAGVGRVGAGRGFDQAGGDDGREYIWTDPDTDRVMNLKVLAAKGLFEHLELASALLDNGWPQSDRGVIDGKHHIECPFEGEHTSPGGTIAWNASDYEKIELPGLKPGAGIICPHNACKNPKGDGQKRDRLEFILEFLREGGLTTADLDKALDAARAADLANDFEPIEDPDSIDLRPLIKPELTWTLDTIKANASQLRRLRTAAPDQYEQVHFYWDFTGMINHTELDRLCDEAPDDIPPKVGKSAGAAGSSEDQIAYWLNYMNQRHFVTSVKGKTRVVTSKEEQETKDQTRQVTYDFSSFPDITNLYANKKVWIETKQGPKQIPVAPLWLSHPERPTYMGGMVFKPGLEVPLDQFNTWQGFGVEPAAGDWSKLRWHMLNIICAGDEGHFNWLLKWCAHMVQYPMINGQVAVVMRGGEGCGKGTLGHVLRRIAGSHGLHVSSQRGVTGNFNAHLANRLLVFADEAFFAGDRASEGVLKALVSEDKILIEPKGIDPIQQDNFIRFIMATNKDWAVPAGVDARRWFVLDVPDTKTGDESYFKALHAEIDHGGLAAFLYDLLRIDLTEWNRANAPKTDGLMDQKLRSLRGIPRWWYERLTRAEEDEQEIEGIDPSNDGGTREYSDCEVWVRELGKTQLYGEYTEWFGRQKAEYQPELDAQFWKEIYKLAPDTTTPRSRKAGRKAKVRLPALAEAWAAFDKFMNGKVPRQTDVSDKDAT